MGILSYSTYTEFTGEEHGFDGITFNVAEVSIGGGAFSVAKDINPAKQAIENFVKEFNDTQKYIEGLTKVNRDGDEVSLATFTGNTEISSLPSKLRKSSSALLLLTLKVHEPRMAVIWLSIRMMPQIRNLII